RPPFSLTTSIGLRVSKGRCSTTNVKPNVRRQLQIQPMISGSVLEMRRTVWLKLPSASNIPARKPADHSFTGDVGHEMRPRIDCTLVKDCAVIACIALLLPPAAWNRYPLAE